MIILEYMFDFVISKKQRDGEICGFINAFAFMFVAQYPNYILHFSDLSFSPRFAILSGLDV
jgi:hypothetical protein